MWPTRSWERSRPSRPSFSLRSNSGDSELYALRNASSTHKVILESRQSSQASKSSPEVRFNRYGTTEYLEGAATASGGSVDFPSVAEKSAAKKSAPMPHTVSALVNLEVGITARVRNGYYSRETAASPRKAW